MGQLANQLTNRFLNNLCSIYSISLFQSHEYACHNLNNKPLESTDSQAGSVQKQFGITGNRPETASYKKWTTGNITNAEAIRRMQAGLMSSLFLLDVYATEVQLPAHLQKSSLQYVFPFLAQQVSDSCLWQSTHLKHFSCHHLFSTDVMYSSRMGAWHRAQVWKEINSKLINCTFSQTFAIIKAKIYLHLALTILPKCCSSFNHRCLDFKWTLSTKQLLIYFLSFSQYKR